MPMQHDRQPADEHVPHPRLVQYFEYGLDHSHTRVSIHQRYLGLFETEPIVLSYRGPPNCYMRVIEISDIGELARGKS